MRKIIHDARYLVLGLGDVYLGAPVATPVDPRHRLVTTKYNPARTWTPENAVGIGGAYMCIYGMEGPGGYQLFGRTLQVWNTWRRTSAFPHNPWLLDYFDQIRFHPVSHAELTEARAAFPQGEYPLRIEETRFRWADEQRVQQAAVGEIGAFKTCQQTAFEAERARWQAAGLETFVAVDPPLQDAAALPDGCAALESPVPGTRWKFLVGPGSRVAAGDQIAIVESMKMEIVVQAAQAGRLVEHRATPGRIVRAGEILAVMETD